MAAIVRKHGVMAEFMHSAIRLQLSKNPGGSECSQVDPEKCMADILQACPGARILPVSGEDGKEGSNNTKELGLWINGVRYPAAGEERPGVTTMENARRQIDGYLLRVERAVKCAVDGLKLGDQRAILVLGQQLSLLADYISTAGNRIVIQQVVDEMMETLLKLKSKLIEYALNSSTPSAHLCLCRHNKGCRND